MAIDFKVDNQTLIITTTGRWSTPEVTFAGEKGSAIAKENHLTSMLVDLHEADVEFPTSDVFNETKKLPALFGFSMKIAVVFPPSSDPKDTRFVENIARNHGLEFKVFTEVAPAKEWLYAD